MKYKVVLVIPFTYVVDAENPEEAEEMAMEMIQNEDPSAIDPVTQEVVEASEQEVKLFGGNDYE